VTTRFEGGTQAETRQSISAEDAAKAAGVHLVFTSAGSANRQTGIPHFDSKYEVEAHIAKFGVGATRANLSLDPDVQRSGWARHSLP
jgi:uncharacterized protein YbjT (DUF2867 family)